MVYVILFVIIFILWFVIYKSKYINPYKVTLICGAKGSGKSTYAVHLALKYLNKKFWVWDNSIRRFAPHRWHVYTNMHMQLDGIYYLDRPEDIGKFTVPEYSVLIFDEINTLPGWDNRDFKNMAKSTITWIRYARQYRVKCFFCLRPGTLTVKSRVLLIKFLFVEMWLVSWFNFARSKKELL